MDDVNTFGNTINGLLEYKKWCVTLYDDCSLNGLLIVYWVVRSSRLFINATFYGLLTIYQVRPYKSQLINLPYGLISSTNPGRWACVCSCYLDAVVRVLVQVPQHTPAAGRVHLPDGALHQAVLPLEDGTRANTRRTWRGLEKGWDNLRGIQLLNRFIIISWFQDRRCNKQLHLI